LRQFHFLKGKFDDGYLQKEAQSPVSPSPAAARLQDMANIHFTDPRSIELYCALTLEAGGECEGRLVGSEEGDANRIGVVLDYLLLHF
jgi:hypothetical protein